MEIKQEVKREPRRGLVWKGLRFIRRIFTYEKIVRPEPGKWHKSPDNAPPMEQLEKLAKSGLKGVYGSGRLDSAGLQRALNIMSSVAQADGPVTDSECAIADRFIRDAGPDGLADAERSRCLENFRQITQNYQQVRGEILLLKKGINPQQTTAVVEALFELSYCGGIEHNQSREVSDIAERFGMPPSDIRMLAAEARRKATK